MGTSANIKKNCAYRTLEYVKGLNGILGYDGGNQTTERFSLPNGCECGGWKLAVKNGVVKAKDTSSRRTRNMNGLTADGRYIHVQTTSKETEKAVATYVNDYIKKYYNTTVQILLIQDAGGSTGCYSSRAKIHTAGEKEGTQGRKVVTVVCAKLKNNPGIQETLKFGSKGDNVRILQQILGGVTIDSIYGNEMKAQSKVAQKNLGLDVDGICGPKTLSKLGLR